jgi:hypothetical protein
MFGKPRFPLPIDESINLLEEAIEKSIENKIPGVGFSEVMTGFIHVGRDVTDFEIATKLARSCCESARFFLTVKSWDTAECEFSRHALVFLA